MRQHQIELLAPAGSSDSMKAAVAAGADAVYIGGDRFGARAYADNPDKDDLLMAIDYAHLHGVSLYLTVNTLLKDREMEELYAYLLPYYERGLDAVIVQDMGVFSYVRNTFPDLPVHASTQMTITGWRGADILRSQGAKRVIPARELSLKEIKKIHDNVDIEIECFVHGALCYCYSGQCLLSSFIGGRSGNRGRCAQPCRLPYDVRKDGQSILPKDKRYVMNLKDLCTLDILPDIIEAGVCSLKIEGRMKSPRYTAGVVSIYRKYLDMYLLNGREGYKVDPEDKAKLLDLFDRGGHTDGYYNRHNGKDMIAFKEKPDFRKVDEEYYAHLDETYVNSEKKELIKGTLWAYTGSPLKLTLSRGKDKAVTAEGRVIESALNAPLDEEKLKKQILKTGGTPFEFEELDVCTDGRGFIPVKELNEVRRDGLDKLTSEILSVYQRDIKDVPYKEPLLLKTQNDTTQTDKIDKTSLNVLLSSPEGFEAALGVKEVCEIQIEADGYDPRDWKEAVIRSHENGKACVLAMPVIFREEAEDYFNANMSYLKEAGFDSFLIRSLEEPGFLKANGIDRPMYADHDLYCFNREAVRWFYDQGFERLTLPLELNRGELEDLGCEDKEMIAYGYLPAMVSAQCVLKNTDSCSHRPGISVMVDRTGKTLPVMRHCTYCYNTIFNPDPLSLLGIAPSVKSLHPRAIRLIFTNETESKIRSIIRSYTDAFCYGKEVKEPSGQFTRGHFKRGVE